MTHDLAKRVAEHNSGQFGGYTAKCLPVELVWSQDFPNQHQAFHAERQIKGWSRAKKKALIEGGVLSVQLLVQEQKSTKRAQRAAQPKQQE
jgi:predicted GIY-YIG superfamily endonuclease